MSKESSQKFTEFSNCLENVLLSEKISPSELAERMGKYPSQISRYMSEGTESKPTPTRKTLRQMNSVLEKVQIIELKDGWKVEKITPVEKATRAVERVEEQGDAYIKSVQDLDDPAVQIRLAQTLLEAVLRILEKDNKT